jgi:hypothetical protein
MNRCRPAGVYPLPLHAVSNTAALAAGTGLLRTVILICRQPPPAVAVTSKSCHPALLVMPHVPPPLLLHCRVQPQWLLRCTPTPAAATTVAHCTVPAVNQRYTFGYCCLHWPGSAAGDASTSPPALRAAATAAAHSHLSSLQ